MESPQACEEVKPTPWQRVLWWWNEWRERLFPKPSNLVLHAECELRIAGVYDKDADYAGGLGEAVMDLVRAHCKHGHSGGSHGYTLALFNKVVNFKTLTPLTNDPDEWMQISGPDKAGFGGVRDSCWQSCRQSSCFSADGGLTYYDLDDPENSLPPEADGWRPSKPKSEWRMFTSAPKA